MAQLSLHLQDQTIGCSLPRPEKKSDWMSVREWKKSSHESYCDPGELLMERFIVDRLSVCASEENRLRESDPFGRFCFAVKDRLHRVDAPPPNEIYMPAGQAGALPLASDRFSIERSVGMPTNGAAYH